MSTQAQQCRFSPKDQMPHIPTTDVEHMKHVVEFLKPEIYRWGSFKIHVHCKALELALKPCGMAAPILHPLSIRCSESERIEDRLVLFDDERPDLRDLHLVGAPVVWTGPLLHNLTTLHLADCEDGFCPSVEELIVIFEALPALQKLTLDDAGISVRAADQVHPEPIRLQELEYLHLTSLD
ncbi:hypothetical protein FRB98_008321 [Tulasnella sp. 332]|nr:hypothetical protein FRB98_008321 [Tulasnella sp. 332]